VLLAVIVLVIGALILVAAVFLGFHVTGSQRVKISASWKSVEVEIERTQPLQTQIGGKKSNLPAGRPRRR
jgi:hypothetical protein